MTHDRFIFPKIWIDTSFYNDRMGRSLCLPLMLDLSCSSTYHPGKALFFVCPGLQENTDYLGDVSDCMVSGKDYFVYVLCVSLGF
jgi:hypothetical protein